MDPWKLHGLMMWISWFVLAMIQITTQRYLKGLLWRQAFWIHAIVGTILYGITLGFAIYILVKMEFYLEKNIHFWFVFPTFILTFFIVLLGWITKCLSNAQDWNTRTILRVKFAHQYLGFKFILIGQGAVVSGINSYRDFDLPLEWIQLSVMFAIVALFEIIYQVIRRKEIPFKATIISSERRLITNTEFQAMVKSGQDLVILDDMVVDISRFMSLHPGGAFSLRHNVGRDISKYFHGGYSLENLKPVKNHLHSSDARRIVNALIIGRLIDVAPTKIMKIVDQEGDANKSGTCRTLKFKTVQTANGGKVQEAEQLIDQTQQYPCPLKDASQIGKHYLLKSTSHPKTFGGASESGTFEDSKFGIKRHYTECFCMRKVIYENLLRIGRNIENSQDEADVVKQAMTWNNMYDLCLTIKNYNQNSGLSRYIYDAGLKGEQVFQVKGPMGQGIGVQNRGKFIAYTGGTGVLVFMDLVAYLLIRVIQSNGGPQILDMQTQRNSMISSNVDKIQETDTPLKTEENEISQIANDNSQIDLANFSFELHTSFASGSEAIGLEMIELLELLCHRFGMNDLFIHHSRISAQNKFPRMCEETFKAKFIEYERSKELNVKKVWVCGPPTMQEHFDRAQKSIPDKKIEYHVL